MYGPPKRERQNIMLDPELRTRLWQEAEAMKVNLSDVIDGRLRASYDEGLIDRHAAMIVQLQQDMARVVEMLTPLAAWLATMGVGAVAQAEKEPTATPTVLEETIDHDAAQFAAESMTPVPQFRPTPQRRHWWKG
jgi:hypothetical protein